MTSSLFTTTAPVQYWPGLIEALQRLFALVTQLTWKKRSPFDSPVKVHLMPLPTNAVTDEEILTAYQILAAEEGIFCEPASAASVAGLLKVKNEVPSGATVVCVLTGNGLKDPEIAIKRQSAQFHQGIPATLEDVATVMGFKH